MLKYENVFKGEGKRIEERLEALLLTFILVTKECEGCIYTENNTRKINRKALLCNKAEEVGGRPSEVS